MRVSLVVATLSAAACSFFRGTAGMSRPVAQAFEAEQQTARSAERRAVQSTKVNESFVELRTYVTFNADGHVMAVCTVGVHADGSALYLPFQDAALAPLNSGRARCGD